MELYFYKYSSGPSVLLHRFSWLFPLALIVHNLGEHSVINVSKGTFQFLISNCEHAIHHTGTLTKRYGNHRVAPI